MNKNEIIYMFWYIYETKNIKEALDFLENKKYFIRDDDEDDDFINKLNNLNIVF